MRAILALSFHPAFTPPKSGGEERLFYILDGLSKYYDVTLISFTHPNKGNIIETVNSFLTVQGNKNTENNYFVGSSLFCQSIFFY